VLPPTSAETRGVELRPATGDWPARVRRGLAETDWTATPVVDVVTYAPATTRGLEGGHMRIEWYRYADPPHPSTHATPERACRVERVTRPLWERLRAEP
jgi:hypothetical protein